MSYKIEIQPSGHHFDAEDGETLLEAGLRHGFNLPYSCRGGACGACKGKIVSGEVSYEDDPIALSATERTAGMALFCQAIPSSDIVLEVKEIGATKDQEIKILPTRVAVLQKLADDVMQMKLKLPMTERLEFLAGQYIDILLKDGRRRSFSLANAPHDDALLELHIRQIPDGYFTNMVFNEMQEKAILRIEGPLGSFFVRDESTNPIIFMAGGTGFAPIKSIIEHLIAQGCQRSMHLYWGVREEKDLYMDALAKEWAANYANIRYKPVLSNIAADHPWQGRRGLVHQAIANDFHSMRNYEVYACGPPAMIDAGRQAFAEKGLESDNFYADAFTYAAN
ncbi:MAG: CDP-6-deoxy-delta-3,4-glucoseen reductase [Gammaproteobacteria bacterium]|nr:CDP-6-deoxy-delta-3,4-glucoseen reductase [Gammaproteobacteria bacterium]